MQDVLRTDLSLQPPNLHRGEYDETVVEKVFELPSGASGVESQTSSTHGYVSADGHDVN